MSIGAQQRCILGQIAHDNRQRGLGPLEVNCDIALVPDSLQRSTS
jgi:hypothetical protein